MIYFILALLVVILYEYKFHNYFKCDLKNEKLISDFSNYRMQLIKMVHLKEIQPNSNYFKFMLKATSYSIRSLYFYKNRNVGLDKTQILNEAVPILLKEETKKEFKDLNSEQKELFAKTILNLILLYTQENYIQKIFIKSYFLHITKSLFNILNLIFEKCLSNSAKEKINIMNDISNSYSLNDYAYVF